MHVYRIYIDNGTTILRDAGSKADAINQAVGYLNAVHALRFPLSDACDLLAAEAESLGICTDKVERLCKTVIA